MMPPHRHGGQPHAPGPPVSAPSVVRVSDAPTTTAIAPPGHHRDKLDRIRDSIKDYQVGPSASQLTSRNSATSMHQIPSTSFPSINGYAPPQGNGTPEKSEDEQMRMIHDLTQLGYDKESAYYALKLISFASVNDAAMILNRIKHNIATQHPAIVTANNGMNFTSTTGNTTTTTFYASPARSAAPPPPVPSGNSREPTRLPRYTNLDAPGPSSKVNGSNFLNVGTKAAANSPDDSRDSSRSQSPNVPRQSPTANWSRTAPPPPEKDYHRSHAKISLKHTTSNDPQHHNFIRFTPLTTIPTTRTPVTAMASAPPSSTVITIERDATPSQMPPPLRRDALRGVPVVKTRIDRGAAPSPPDANLNPHISVSQQSNNPKVAPVLRTMYIRPSEQPSKPSTSNSNGTSSVLLNSDTSNSTYVSYVDQLCLKGARLTLKERDSVLGSEHASGGNVSPARSSGFTSPVSLVESEPQNARRRSGSPLPASVAQKLKTKNYERFVKPCKPGMFQFFMEQHIDSVVRQYEERNQRALQLLNEMEAANLNKTFQEQMLQLLRQKESKYIRLKRQKMNKNMFDIIQHIGVGAFGKVALVRKKDTNQTYAMKILNKEDVINKKQSAHVKAERDILAEANSPWIVKLFFSFQDSRNLYFIMEYVPGGDMMQLLIVKGVFTESLSRFYIAELTCAIEYVHSLGFIHRDIKPDNILLDRKGHIKLTDFGLCTGLRWTHDKRRYVVYEEDDPNAFLHVRDDSLSMPAEAKENTRMKLLDYRQHKKRNKAHSVVGTGNYMAPEVIEKTGHTQLCDWWSVGVILYEMVFGRPPFMSMTENPYETQIKIKRWREYLDLTCMSHLPAPLSPNCIDVIAKLCCDQRDRLGSKNGAADIKAHPWFKGIDFDNLRETTAEFIPKVEHAEDTSNFDVGDMNCQDFLKNETLKGGSNAFNPAFYDFTFRHFFDCEVGRTRPQQRPSLAPLIEATTKATASGSSSTTTTMATSSASASESRRAEINARQAQKDPTRQRISKAPTIPPEGSFTRMNPVVSRLNGKQPAYMQPLNSAPFKRYKLKQSQPPIDEMQKQRL